VNSYCQPALSDFGGYCDETADCDLTGDPDLFCCPSGNYFDGSCRHGTGAACATYDECCSGVCVAGTCRSGPGGLGDQCDAGESADCFSSTLQLTCCTSGRVG